MNLILFTKTLKNMYLNKPKTLLLLLIALVTLAPNALRAQTVSNFTNLKNALEDPQDATVTLGSDIVVTGTIKVNGTKTLIAGNGTTIYRDGVMACIRLMGNNTNLTVKNITFDGRTSSAATDPFKSQVSFIYVDGTDAILNMENCNVNNCHLESKPQISSESDYVYNNFGAAVAFSPTSGSDNAELKLTNCTFTNNKVTNNGAHPDYGSAGAVYIVHTGGTISENTATNGGGVYVNTDGTAEVTGGTISENAATNGGGMYVHTTGTANVTGGTFTLNTASNHGGGVYISTNAVMNLNGTGTDGVLIKHNHADKVGGGVYKMGSLRVGDKVVITDNTSSGQ